jgi:hypothetical protein
MFHGDNRLGSMTMAPRGASGPYMGAGGELPSQGAGRIASLQRGVTYKISHWRSRLPRLLHGQL